MKNQMQATMQGRFGPNSYRTTAKVVGVVYLLGFVIGIVGSGLIQSSLGGPDLLMGVINGAVRSAGTGAGVNPFTISHTAMNTSHRPPGIEEARPRPEPMTSEIIPQKMIAYPTRPQIASGRGTSLALYSV